MHSNHIKVFVSRLSSNFVNVLAVPRHNYHHQHYFVPKQFTNLGRYKEILKFYTVTINKGKSGTKQNKASEVECWDVVEQETGATNQVCKSTRQQKKRILRNCVSFIRLLAEYSTCVFSPLSSFKT